MGILDLFRPKMRRFEDGGQWCEVGTLRRTYFDGTPCYEIDGRGDWSFYLGGNDPLDVEESRNGWTIRYVPGEESDFFDFAASLEEIGEWD